MPTKETVGITFCEEHVRHNAVGFSHCNMQRRFVVVVEDVCVGIVVQQRLDVVVQRHVDGDVEGSHHLPTLGRVHRVVHEVWVHPVLEHVLQNRRVRLPSGQDDRTGELLRRPVANVGGAEFGDFRVVVQMSLEDGPQLFQIILTYRVQNVGPVVLHHGHHAHGVAAQLIRMSL